MAVDGCCWGFSAAACQLMQRGSSEALQGGESGLTWSGLAAACLLALRVCT